MKPEITIDLKDIYFAVIQGEDERGNPIYGEPQKLNNVKTIEIKEEY